MEKETFKISFEEDFPDVRLHKDAALSETLTIENSPILFGCRIGICGTCSVEVLEDSGLHPRTAEEAEYLEALCPEKPNSRLACQIHLCANIKVRKIDV
jgi:ferredoxin